MPHAQAERSAGADRLQLSGRLLLTFIFLFQAIHGEKGGLHSVLTAPSLFNVLSSLLLLGLSTMVCVGFHTEWSSLVLSLVLLLSTAVFVVVRRSFRPTLRSEQLLDQEGVNGVRYDKRPAGSKV